MNFSYKRYWEPSTSQVLGTSLAVGAVANYLTYPIEFVKTRIQVKAEGVGIRNKNMHLGYNPHKTFRQIHATGAGFQGLFYGVESFLAARLSYILVRNYLYKTIYDTQKPYKPSNDLSTRERAAIAAFAGGVAALVSNPLELISTRMIADGGIYKPNRRNYASMGDAWNKIAQEGKPGLFRGALSNVIRAAVLNVSFTGPYDYLNEKCWITFGEMHWVNNTLAFLWASMWGTIAVTPVDNLKTRMMIQFPDAAKNRVGYSGYVDCIAKTFQNEGIFSFWTGAWAMYYKVFFYGLVTLGCTNQLKRKWKEDAGLEEWQM